MGKRCFSVVACLMIHLFYCQAQSISSPEVWKNIETSIHQRKDLQSTWNRLESIRNEAKIHESPVELARALCYMMLIRDVKTEDSLYFQNSSFIDSILNSNSTQELKLLMHCLQGQRLWRFRTKYLKFNRARYETNNDQTNYAALSDEQLDSCTNYHFNKAIQLADSVDLEKVCWNTDNILWLSSTPLVFLFKPALKDIISFEQITAMESLGRRNILAGVSWKDWLSFSQEQMIDSLHYLKVNNRLSGSTMFFVRWLEVHKQNPGVYYFIETLLRESLYRSLYPDYNLVYQKAYETYLKGILSSKYREVKARAVYELVTLWKNWADKYSGSSYRYDNYVQPFDTVFKPYAADALQLLENNKHVFEGYSFLLRSIENLKSEILLPRLQVVLEKENENNKPLLVRIQYKNLPSFFYKIVRLGADEDVIADKAFLLAQPIIGGERVDLPLPVDYNLHRTLLKLGPLPVGRYCLVFSDVPVDKSQNYSYQSFVVSDVAVLQSKRKVFLLNRSTGEPLKGVLVKTNPLQKQAFGVTKARTGDDGFFDLSGEGRFELTAFHGSDTLRKEVFVGKDNSADNIFTRDEYDDLVEFYDDNAKVMIFTDRGIYRPGQKVFYKAVLVTKNPNTGQLMIMNQKHLKKGFHNYLKKWCKEMEPLLYLKDPFGRDIDSVGIKPGEYGSVSGSFTIPVNATTGEWSIESDYLDSYGENDGSFKVEEYKRPSFELTVDKPTRNYKIPDTLHFKIKVKAFSGSIFDHTLIKYRIEREYCRDMPSLTEKIIVDSNDHTDQNGQLQIRFLDADLKLVDRAENITLVYNLFAEVTDVAGETHDVSATLRLSTRPVNIRVPISTIVDLADLKPLLINAKDNNGVPVLKDLRVRLLRVEEYSRGGEVDVSTYTDQWIHTVQQLKSWFPAYRFFHDTTEPKEELVFETKISTEVFEKFRWPEDKILPGKYRLLVSTYEDGFLAGESSRAITVFDSRAKDLPAGENSFFFVPANLLSPGETLRVFSGSVFDTTYTVRELKYYSLKSKKSVVVRYFNEYREKGVHEWKWKIPDDASENMLLTEMFVAGNILYKHEEQIRISSPKNSQPEIVIEQFRRQLYPGQQTSYSVSIKTKNENIAAELMTCIYDASLDKLTDHYWKVPSEERNKSLYNNWPSTISTLSDAELSIRSKRNLSFHETPVWWMDTVTFSYSSEGFIEAPQILEGRVPGLMITNAGGIEDVAVVGYGKALRAVTGSVALVQIRGISSLEQYKQPLIILDGIQYTGDLSSINLKEVTAAIVLRGADAVALYGAKASEGVLIISTKGEIALPSPKQELVVKVRGNFNETAYFSPAIYADKKGFYTFSFTMPESVTEWNWKLFAHTKAAEFMYAERKLVTQLPLMVQPHLPANFYQGDRIVLKSRISNLDSLQQRGIVSCKVEDALTGEEIGGVAFNQLAKDFKVEPHSTNSASFALVVPEVQQHPLRVTIVAKTDAFADGEEHVIPVLSKRILAKMNQSIRVTGRDTLVNLPLSDDMSSFYGSELSIEPKPQTALLNSLPFLAHYSYDCAEQMFNKLYAYVIAVNIVRRDTSLQRLIRNRPAIDQTSLRDKLPDFVIEQSMPWLGLAKKTKKEQSELLELLDTMKSNDQIGIYIERILKSQNVDGGISWFEGGRSDSYISCYLLAGFGKLDQLGWLPFSKNPGREESFKKFIEKLTRYSDDLFLRQSQVDIHDGLWIAYARSFWMRLFPVPGGVQSKVKSCIDLGWKEARSLQSKAILVTTALRFFFSDSVEKEIATRELQSIKEAAIVDDHGIRWKAIADADDLQTSDEETLALLVEAFETAHEQKAIAPGIIRWLLTTKNEQSWKTTKGTAATVDLLLKERSSAFAETHVVTAVGADSPMTVSDDLLSGNSSVFQKTGGKNGIQMKNSGGQTVDVNIGWYYFSEPQRLNELNAGVSLTKEWYRSNPVTHSWENADSNTVFRVGEKVKVVIRLETGKALRYVWLNDKRSAAFEPEEYNSGYRYGKYFGYYQSIRDDGIDFFAEFVPSGKTELEYELVIAQEGRFCGGLATLQCMYKPSVTSYSNIGAIKVE